MSGHLVRRITAALSGRKGVTAAEYAILAVGIVIIVGAAATAFGPQLTAAFNNVGNQITTQQSNVSTAVR